MVHQQPIRLVRSSALEWSSNRRILAITKIVVESSRPPLANPQSMVLRELSEETNTNCTNTFQSVGIGMTKTGLRYCHRFRQCWPHWMRLECCAPLRGCANALQLPPVPMLRQWQCCFEPYGLRQCLFPRSVTDRCGGCIFSDIIMLISCVCAVQFHAQKVCLVSPPSICIVICSKA